MRNLGGQKVGRGTYWNLAMGSSVHIEDEGVLPGDKTTSYVRINRFVMMIIGPILGFLYVIFMPILALFTVVALAGGKLLEGLFALAGKSMSFGWRPSNSYLSGKDKGKVRKEKDEK